MTAENIIIVTSTASALGYATVKSDKSDSINAQRNILTTFLEIAFKCEFEA